MTLFLIIVASIITAVLFLSLLPFVLGLWPLWLALFLFACFVIPLLQRKTALWRIGRTVTTATVSRHGFAFYEIYYKGYLNGDI